MGPRRLSSECCPTRDDCVSAHNVSANIFGWEEGRRIFFYISQPSRKESVDLIIHGTTRRNMVTNYWIARESDA